MLPLHQAMSLHWHDVIERTAGCAQHEFSNSMRCRPKLPRAGSVQLLLFLLLYKRRKQRSHKRTPSLTLVQGLSSVPKALCTDPCQQDTGALLEVAQRKNQSVGCKVAALHTIQALLFCVPHTSACSYTWLIEEVQVEYGFVHVMRLSMRWLSGDRICPTPSLGPLNLWSFF